MRGSRRFRLGHMLNEERELQEARETGIRLGGVVSRALEIERMGT